MFSIGNHLMRHALTNNHLPAALLDDASKLDTLSALFKRAKELSRSSI
ncbi:hypothetical protein SPHFLASMR4Y_02432 [Sphingorhabdus sp. SMR4y]|nr:hypothetical protein SPHFLASMR4Y_02432 [Sphingorhabdus sp. SMR4y]